jgi:hypothetical protein
MDANPVLIEFFESPVGTAFLHRLVTSAHVSFTKAGSASIHNVSDFLERALYGYKVCVTEDIVIANAARAHENLDLVASKSGPAVIKAAVPLIRKPVPGPFLPATLLLPMVINTSSIFSGIIVITSYSLRGYGI